MKNKVAKRVIVTFISILFWIFVWELISRAVKIPSILPSIFSILESLMKLSVTANFWKTILLSCIRILSGFVIGVGLGIALSFASFYNKAVMTIISPMMTVIRATPVASFILVVWLLIGSDLTPIAITVMMVTPIIWQNLIDGFKSMDNELIEVSKVFEFSRLKRFMLIIAPTLIRYFVPAIITALGLGWKSGIAAEIIAYTQNSIGREIFIAKNYVEGAEMLAWTLVVILISLLFEFVITSLGRRLEAYGFNIKQDK